MLKEEKDKLERLRSVKKQTPCILFGFYVLFCVFCFGYFWILRAIFFGESTGVNILTLYLSGMDALETMPMVLGEEETKESLTLEPQRDAWRDLKGTLLPKVPKCW